MHYAAIITEPGDVAPAESGPASAEADRSNHSNDKSSSSRPAPPPELARRADFRVGHCVTFIDKQLQPRVGLIVRINPHTATLDCDDQKWRVAFELLRPLVDV